MDELLLRLLLILKALVPFVFFMAAIYLALHVVFARFLSGPQSTTLWFFAVVTQPLTRPVRAVLAPATPEPRVRLIALGVYGVLWLTVRFLFNTLFGWPPAG